MESRLCFIVTRESGLLGCHINTISLPREHTDGFLLRSRVAGDKHPASADGYCQADQ